MVAPEQVTMVPGGGLGVRSAAGAQAALAKEYVATSNNIAVAARSNACRTGPKPPIRFRNSTSPPDTGHHRRSSQQNLHGSKNSDQRPRRPQGYCSDALADFQPV